MKPRQQHAATLGLPAAWAIAVGGMVGGGVFATMGLVISSAGQWAALSFVLGGAVALATGYSLTALTVDSDEPGGLYSFLRDQGAMRAARVSAWIMLSGYMLTCAVYAYTFGSYLAHAIGGPQWMAPAMATVIILVMTAVNLLGAGQAAAIEIAIVVVKLAILGALAAFGIARFDTAQLAIAQQPGASGVVVGAASVFIAYVGFELLSYDYADMRDREKTISYATPLAIASATAIYIAMVIAVPMLAGTEAIIENGETVLLIAGKNALGLPGLIAVTIAAALSTASALNATIFSTARLAREVAQDGGLPGSLKRLNRKGSPYWAVLVLASLALALAIVGGLGGLVRAASIVFLLVFGLLNALALRRKVGYRWISAAGATGAFGAMFVQLAHFLGLI